MAISYKDSGVDIELADHFVAKISKMVKSTYNENVVNGVGGFCALYKMSENRYLASSTDGVGTKLKLAIELNKHDTIGQDLVAMCVNDLICSGARPLFFLDYFASSKLKLETSLSVMEGLVNACKESNMALIGGETAEMPGLYQENDYDLAGFSVGEVYKENLIDGLNIKSGDTLIAIKSSGFHSNGFSLIRKILDEVGTQKLSATDLNQLKLKCLTPTRIYVDLVLNLIEKYKKNIKGLAHITGSGFLNIPRINENFNYSITELAVMPDFMNEVCQMSGLSSLDLHKTFNMGVGLVIATDQPELILNDLNKESMQAFKLGYVEAGSGKVFIKNEELV